MKDKLLSPEEIKRLDKVFSKNADKLIANHYKSLSRKAALEVVTEDINKLGRKPMMLTNTVIDYIGKTSTYGLYPVWALDIIEGVARLDWDSKPTDSPLKSSMLSVKNLCLILSSCEEISTKRISLALDMKERHAQRYLKACRLMMPYLEKSIPKKVDIKCIEWLDLHDLIPDPVELAQLHYDMREL